MACVGTFRAKRNRQTDVDGSMCKDTILFSSTSHACSFLNQKPSYLRMLLFTKNFVGKTANSSKKCQTSVHPLRPETNLLPPRGWLHFNWVWGAVGAPSMLVVTALLEQQSEDQSYEKHSSIRPAASTGHSVSTSQRRQVYSVSVRLFPQLQQATAAL